MHCCWKCSRLIDPGGVIGFSFLYAFLPSKLATDSLAWEMSLGVAPAVTRPATKKRRLDESKSGDDGAEVSTSDCFFKEGA